MSCKILPLEPDFEYFKKNPIINYKFVPVDLEFDYEQGKSKIESIFEQFWSIPTTVLTRFIELLPSKPLRLFSFTSKFHYIQCLRIRGIEVERFIYSSISEKPGNTCLTANGTVIYNYRSNFHHPIITFFKVIGVVGVDCCDIDTQFDKYMYNLKLLIHENVERAEFRMIFYDINLSFISRLLALFNYVKILMMDVYLPDGSSHIETVAKVIENWSRNKPIPLEKSVFVFSNTVYMMLHNHQLMSFYENSRTGKLYPTNLYNGGPLTPEGYAKFKQCYPFSTFSFLF